MREELLKIAESLPSENSFKFVSLAKVKEKAVRGALKSYAANCPYEDIIAIMDTSLMHSGKSGFILTAKRLYSNLFVSFLNDKIMYVPLEGLTEVKPDKENSLLLTYSDGSANVIYLSIHAPYIKDLLQAIIELKNTQNTTADVSENIPAKDPAVHSMELEQPPEKTVSEAEPPAGTASETVLQTDSLEDEWQTYEKEKMALEREKIAFKKEKAAFEHEKQMLGSERRAFEDQKKAFENEKQALKNEWQALEHEKEIFQKERKAFHPDSEASYQKASVPDKNKSEAEVSPEQTKEWPQKGKKQQKQRAQQESQKPDSSFGPEEIFQNAMSRYIEKDYKKAAVLFEKAAKTGHEKAQKMLASCFQKGIGVPVDKEKALSWLKKSAEHGDADTQFMVGLWYMKGEGVKADMETAERWMKKASLQGHEKAAEAIQVIRRHRGIEYYNTGISKLKIRVLDEKLDLTQQDITDALPYFEKAAELGLVEAYVVIASYFLYGNTNCIPNAISNISDYQTDADEKKGMYWLKKAAENEDANSMFIYAKYLFYGGPFSVDELRFEIQKRPQDYDRTIDKEGAFEYAVKASNLGCTKAYLWLLKLSEKKVSGADEALRHVKEHQKK